MFRWVGVGLEEIDLDANDQDLGAVRASDLEILDMGLGGWDRGLSSSPSLCPHPSEIGMWKSVMSVPGSCPLGSFHADVTSIRITAREVFGGKRSFFPRSAASAICPASAQPARGSHLRVRELDRDDFPRRRSGLRRTHGPAAHGRGARRGPCSRLKRGEGRVLPDPGRALVRGSRAGSRGAWSTARRDSASSTAAALFGEIGSPRRCRCPPVAAPSRSRSVPIPGSRRSRLACQPGSGPRVRLGVGSTGGASAGGRGSARLAEAIFALALCGSAAGGGSSSACSPVVDSGRASSLGPSSITRSSSAGGGGGASAATRQRP